MLREGFTENSSSTVSQTPNMSDAMSRLTSDAVGYRASTGVSITNRDEYASALESQKSLAKVFNGGLNLVGQTATAASLASDKVSQYTSNPSFYIINAALQLFGMGLDRGVQSLEAKSKSNPCNYCTKHYKSN